MSTSWWTQALTELSSLHQMPPSFIDILQLPPGAPSMGVEGRVPTVYVDASITIGAFTHEVPLRILAPRSRAQRQALAHIPSLLGRDILSHFALFFEERTNHVLLLTPEEAGVLNLP